MTNEHWTLANRSFWIKILLYSNLVIKAKEATIFNGFMWTNNLVK